MASAVVLAPLAMVTALALERFRFRGQKVFDALLYLPIIIPDVTMAVMMLLFFSQFFDVLETVFGLNIDGPLSFFTARADSDHERPTV